jgi:ADP-ribose pyrophosphatase
MTVPPHTAKTVEFSPLPSDLLTIRDEPTSRIVRHRQVLAAGKVFDFVYEDVELAENSQAVRREFLQHPGAVAVIALDERGRVLLQRQYRHPVRRQLWEPPAGLLDLAGEQPLAAAQRELFEEADLLAGDWRRLVTFHTTPGGSTETIRVFLARELTAVPPAERYVRVDEEADLAPVWFPLPEAVSLVMSGALASPTAVVGILAAARAADQPGGFDSLEQAS